MFGISSNKKFLGIDIGTYTIKVVEVSRKNKNFFLENYGEVPTALTGTGPFRPSEKNSLAFSDQSIASAIKAVCQEAGIKTVEANFSIPDYATFFTNLEIPVMDKEEIPQAVQYEIRPYIPLPLSEINLDWIITEGEPSKTPLKLLIAAIPNWVINQYSEISNLSGLKIRFLESEAFALSRVAGLGGAGKTIGMVDMGARSTTCGVVKNGILKTSYSFNIAGNELTDRLSKSLSIDFGQAEALKREFGLAAGDAARRDVGKILIPLVDLMVEEIKKVFRTFYQNEGEEVERIVLSGGCSLLPGLKEYLFANLKKEISSANPFTGLVFPPALRGILEQRGPSYATAVGLAVKGLE